MRCQEFNDYLDDYCRGSLGETQGREIDSHLTSCEQCTAAYLEHLQFLNLMAKEPEMVIDPAELADFLPGVWQKIDSRRKVSVRNWLFKLVPSLAAAALLAILVFQPGAKISNGYADFFSPTYFNPASIYSDSTYYDLLGLMFSQENTEQLSIYDDELSNETGLFGNSSISLDNLSDEGLEYIDNKLTELYNKAG